MSHLRLFEHPANSQRGVDGVPVLMVTGNLPSASPLVAYEGRLQILNAAGDCTVQKVSGDLPRGASIYVDNATKEVVVAWPSYEEGVAPILNPGFEAGDIGWERGPGWSITAVNPPTGAKAMQYLNHGGESPLINTARATIEPGAPITASCSVRQGASSSGNAGAAVALQFYDAAGAAFRVVEGNRVMSASNNAVKPSTVNTVAPAGAAAVAIGSIGIRKRQNREVWVDSFTWNVTQPSVGTNDDRMWCITVRVRDALGREADWSGCIDIHATFHRWWLAFGGNTQVYATDDLLNGPWTSGARTPAEDRYSRPKSAGRGRAIIAPTDSDRSRLFQTTDLNVGDGVSGANVSLDWGLFFALSDDGILTAAKGGNFYVSTDGGATFTTHGQPTTNFGGQAPVKIGSRWITLFRNTGNIAKIGYTDGGTPKIAPADWTQISLGYSDGSPQPIACNGTVATIAQSNGTIRRSVDGATWTVVGNIGGRERLHFAKDHIFIHSIDQVGNIGISRDYGLTWQTVYTGVNATPTDAEYHDGILVLSYNAVFTPVAPRYSLDDGVTWAPMPLPAAFAGGFSIGVGAIAM